MGNGCSVSGGWFRKALEHEYIDKRVLLVVTLFFLFFIFCRILRSCNRQKGMGAVSGTAQVVGRMV